jgi:MoxR-like ATPase|tara:strand:- start:5540 stop:6727 length:1188 start_codon:yes stop_codon:yes gene_type:complete
MTQQLLQYGAKKNPAELSEILAYIFERNNDLSKQGKRPTPVCIWGTHGLGKTELVHDFATSRGWKFAYIAPAQFEEMGDLHGMPMEYDPTPEAPNSGDEVTIYYAPDWVPTDEGPGILLLDDLNRADDRILRGCMQLLQNFELKSWKLPDKWQIVATANPEGGDYSVTPMDDAMITRMMHVTMVFDPKVWAKWAMKNGVDERGIDFVLTYPETVTNKRTTPRTLTQFFQQTNGIGNLQESEELVRVLGESALDNSTVTAFISYIRDGLQKLIEPADILNAEDFETINQRLDEIGHDEQTVTKKDEDGNLVETKIKKRRVDRLNAQCYRMLRQLCWDDRYQAEPAHKDNLVAFLKCPIIPSDLRTALYMDISREARNGVLELLQDESLAKEFLGNI